MDPIDPTPVFGPAACFECHVPGLYFFRGGGWLERRFVGEAQGYKQFAFIAHRCTARDVPPQISVAALKLPETPGYTTKFRNRKQPRYPNGR